MTPYYPARDGHPSIFESEGNAAAVGTAPPLPSTRISGGVLQSPGAIRTSRAVRLSAMPWSLVTWRIGHV
jgi:hypothetical protein